MNLLPIPSLSLTPEELNAAVSRGHRIVVAATRFSNYRLQPIFLPRPSRYELEEALRKSGFDRERARRASLAAGGSLGIEAPSIDDSHSQLPGWCSETGLLADFLPMLLIGGWDDSREIDRDLLSRLSGRSVRRTAECRDPLDAGRGFAIDAH